jgi:putative addiction module component (TIGR02574 family)
MNKELIDLALKLPPNERLAFAELILASLEHEEEEVRQEWIKEVNERMKAVNQGKAKLLDFDELYNEG